MRLAILPGPHAPGSPSRPARAWQPSFPPNVRLTEFIGEFRPLFLGFPHVRRERLGGRLGGRQAASGACTRPIGARRAKPSSLLQSKRDSSSRWTVGRRKTAGSEVSRSSATLGPAHGLQQTRWFCRGGAARQGQRPARWQRTGATARQMAARQGQRPARWRRDRGNGPPDGGGPGTTARQTTPVQRRQLCHMPRQPSHVR